MKELIDKVEKRALFALRMYDTFVETIFKEVDIPTSEAIFLKGVISLYRNQLEEVYKDIIFNYEKIEKNFLDYLAEKNHLGNEISDFIYFSKEDLPYKLTIEEKYRNDIFDFISGIYHAVFVIEEEDLLESEEEDVTTEGSNSSSYREDEDYDVPPSLRE